MHWQRRQQRGVQGEQKGKGGWYLGQAQGSSSLTCSCLLCSPPSTHASGSGGCPGPVPSTLDHGWQVSLRLEEEEQS